jgi:hypothetical protein
MLPTLFRPCQLKYGVDSQRLTNVKASLYIGSHTICPSRLVFWGSSSKPSSKLLKILWKTLRDVVGKPGSEDVYVLLATM